MTEQQKIELLSKYWEGKQNKFSRYWMYFRLANGAINEFKSYAYVLTGIYATTPYLREHLVVTGIVLSIGIVIVIPMMLAFGHWLLYRANPASEYASATKGSVYGFKGVEATIETAENTREILKHIQNGK